MLVGDNEGLLNCAWTIGVSFGDVSPYGIRITRARPAK